jgi:predicted nucleic-acid-binding protein
MTILDANAVLRCILQDDEESAALVNDQMTRESFILLSEVVAEIVYVLLKVYRVDRKTIAQAVSLVTRLENAVVPNEQVIQMALHYFGETSFDFVDCLLIGHALTGGHQILTFDKKLRNFLGKSQ